MALRFSLFSVTDSAGHGVVAGQNPRPGARKVVLTLLRVAGANFGILAIYYLLPLDKTSTGGAIALLAAGLLRAYRTHRLPGARNHRGRVSSA